MSRRGFLTGRLRPGDAPLRPPWSLPEAAFTSRCTRCGDCIAACPEAIVVVGSGRFPEVDFRKGACTFCEACREACPTGAIRASGTMEAAFPAPWSIKARIGAACLPRHGVECRVCEERCEPRAIRFRRRGPGMAVPVIDHHQCTGCGACVSVCPVDAVEVRPGPA